VDEDRIVRVISADGTEITGRVRGQGQPLVLVHGGLSDGNPDTNLMVPFLLGHFTCYSISTRGRGVSADCADHSRERQYEDVAAFLEDIGEPVCVFAHSSGAAWVLGGAARAAASCRAIALYEPALPESRPVMREDAYARFSQAITDGRYEDAVLISVDDIIVPTDEERALFTIPAVMEICTSVLSAAALEIPELNRPFPIEMLDTLAMPALLMQGTRSGDHFKDAVHRLAEALPRSRVVDIDGAGHLGPMTHAQTVANELIFFFED
jgi:pimeloyl-ACP methyl ester carboxylesterase